MPDPHDSGDLLCRTTTERMIFGGKPIVRGCQLWLEQVLRRSVSGDRRETILAGYAW